MSSEPKIEAIAPAYRARSVRLYCGHVLAVLPQLPAESVHMCVTSPPFWGLRSYGHWEQQQVWGTLDDFFPPRRHRDRWLFRLRWRAGERSGIFSPCRKTWIGAYGLEPTPELYIQHTVEIFREVRRVLRDDGTLWLNLGDSYASSSKNRTVSQATAKTTLGGGLVSQCAVLKQQSKVVSNLKPKDLVGIPWRVALALQADGWYLRSDIIWSKPNPMPESVQDRPTKAHEYIFLLTKKPKYFYDAEAIREGATHPVGTGVGWGHTREQSPQDNREDNGRQRDENRDTSTRNKRSVWTVTTKPFPGAHFAVFPPDLIEPCILAGTSNEGCCPGCGAPWWPIVEKKRIRTRPGKNSKAYDRTTGETVDDGMEKPWRDRAEIGNRDPGRHVTKTKTVGWEPSCECNLVATSPIPCTVLDPFMGSGTTAVVARRNGRDTIGIELNPEYIEMAKERMPDALLF